MADIIAPVSSATSIFDAAAIQAALVHTQSIAAQKSALSIQQKNIKDTDINNARALDSAFVPTTTPATLNNGLLNLVIPTDPSVTVNPASPSTLSIFNEVDANAVTTNTKSNITAQQLHDIATLQKDAALLEEAANAVIHIPLSNNASTVDLSLQAQDIVNTAELSLVNDTPSQLTQLGDILRTNADAPLTQALLQQIQAQLTANQNPILLSLSTLALAMNYVGGAQINSGYVIEHTALPVTAERIITPVSAIDRIAIEDSTI